MKYVTMAPGELRMRVPMTRPTSMTSTLPRVNRPRSATSWFHTGGWSPSWVPSTLPAAPTANATRVEATPMRVAATVLATITRPRCGMRVNVVSAVRWLHSEVTDRTATMGRMTDVGTLMAVVNVAWVSSAGDAHRTMAPVVSTDAMTTLSRSHNPARVSTDLRSSTATMRASGMPGGAKVG